MADKGRYWANINGKTMNTWKQKSSWLAVAGTSLMLAACGGDSSSSSGGLSLEPLTYTGAETEAAINADNYQAIAEETHGVVLAKLAGDKLVDPLDGPGLRPIVGPRMVSEAVVDIQRSTLSAMNKDSEIRAAIAAPSGEVSSGEEYTHTYSTTIDGDCGGTATTEMRMTSSTKESGNLDTELAVSEQQSKAEITANFRDFCNTLADNETEIVLNGSLSRNDSYTDKEDEVTKTRSEDGRGSSSGKSTVTIAGNSYTVETAMRSRYHDDEVYVDLGEGASEYQYNPDTYVDESSEVVVISGAGISAKYTYNESCEVAAEDRNSIICTESEALQSGNSIYKIEGSIRNNTVYATVYLPDYGSVTVRNGSMPSVCEDYDALSNGELSINVGEIIIDYSSCSDEPVVTRDGVSDLMNR